MPSEMEIQRMLEERMKALLEHANYQSVADELGVTRTTVWRWARGDNVTPGALSRVLTVMRPDLPDTTKEAAPPDWVRRLPTDVAEEVVRLLAGPESPLVAELEDVVERLGLLRGEEHRAESEASQGSTGTDLPRS